ncbi:putative ABC transport system permease protein [Bacilli bacterium PM5-3]|nr:putative ABC transport system permease protein [Bacilli bacterium PM5-3]
MLEIKNIKKTYHMSNHDVVALDDVTLNVKPGNLVAIVGPSGCGKTSLMNIIGALDSDFSGDVVVNGKSLKEAHSSDVDTYRKNTIGFIFQHFTLINSLNTTQNVELAFEISNVKNSEKKQRTQELLKSVGLEEHAKKKVNVLSGGQKQRVAIARALANNPDIILADEPTGALDYKTGIQVMEILKEIAKEKIVIMVTHSDELAKEYANVIVSMEDGHIIDVKDNIEPTKREELIQQENTSKSNMGLFTAVKLAYRNLKLKKGRTIWTSIGMSIGIIGIALALALTTGTRKTVEDQVLQIFPANTVVVTKEKKDTRSNDIEMLKYSDFEKIKELAKKADSALFVPQTFMPTIFSTDKKTADIERFQKQLEEGKEMKPYTFYMMDTIASSYSGNIGYGRLPNKDKPYELMISLTTAEELISDNETVKSLINKNLYLAGMNTETNETFTITFKIVGITSEKTLFSTVYYSETFLDNLTKDYLDRDIKKEKASLVVLIVNDGSVKEYVEGLNDKQDKYVFETASDSVMNTVNTILDVVRNGLVAFSSVSVVVAILMIAIVVYISVLERKQEIGIIRAIGGKTKDIRNMFLAESLTIGLLSGLIGTSIAYGICFVINQIIWNILQSISENTPMMNVANLEPSVALMLIGICGLLSVISGLIPSLKAARLDPIDAIRKK